MRIVVVGGEGQLGREVLAAFASHGDEVDSLAHSDIAVEEISSISHAFEERRPDVIINTAAMHHVENCEHQPDRAFAVNSIGSLNLALVARKLNAVLMQISTDYVFDGEKRHPYTEEDSPRPLNIYGVSKLAGEHLVRSTTEKHFIVRTSGLYGKNPCRAKGGLNFVELMLKLARERGEVRVVDSEIVSPTSTAELAEQLFQLSRSTCYGLYHATAEGSCSWYEFAQEIFKASGTSVLLRAAGVDEFPAKVPRPKYSVLENKALKARSLNIFKPWQSGLHAYLQQRP